MGTESHTFDFVVLATGVYSSLDKFIPQYEGAGTFEGIYAHSVDFKDLSVCKDKHVISVGYGKSAFDCAQLSAKVAEKSTLLFVRRIGRSLAKSWAWCPLNMQR